MNVYQSKLYSTYHTVNQCQYEKMPTSSLSSSSDSCTFSGNGLNLKPSWNTSSYISSYTAISSSKSLGLGEMQKELTKKFSEAREKKLIENWRKRKEKKKSKNQEAEAKLKNERKENLKRKQEVWKEQVEKSKRRKVNPPIAAIREEDDEKRNGGGRRRRSKRAVNIGGS